MKFLLLMDQGQGCDYTIGCGKNWEIFEAENVAASKTIVEDLVLSPEYDLVAATLIPIRTHMDIDVDDIYKRRDEEIEAKKNRDKARADIKLLEELKKKYE